MGQKVTNSKNTVINLLELFETLPHEVLYCQTSYFPLSILAYYTQYKHKVNKIKSY